MTLAKDQGAKTSVYHVDGIKGDHCRDRIEHTLMHLGGVAEVKVDVEAGMVTVSYNPAIIPSGYIETTLQSIGYGVIDR